ncbi:MAG: FHA domain-containing protein [Halobacteriovoraceae bacterium]|nr:FHA domain-containing protein [Halobacteriovoraceae bacterium]
MSELKWFLYDIENEEKVTLQENDNLTIGRASACDLVVRHGSVSGRHAKIIRKEDAFYLHVLNSFSPTFINGKEIKPEINTKLKVRDVIRFGQKIYFFSSLEPNQGAIELSSITDTFNINSQKTSDLVIHNYEEPILEIDQKKNNTTSLKSLRKEKNELEELNDQLTSLESEKLTRDKKRQYFNNKLKELREFNTYLKSKKYESEGDVHATIKSIHQVSERIDLDVSKLEEQIAKLTGEIHNLKKEKSTNEAIVNELTADIEIIKGRDNLKSELQALQKEINSWKEAGLSQKLIVAKELIEEKEKTFKKVQKDYADSRFGEKTGMFNPKKKAS